MKGWKFIVKRIEIIFVNGWKIIVKGIKIVFVYGCEIKVGGNEKKFFFSLKWMRGRGIYIFIIFCM